MGDRHKSRKLRDNVIGFGIVLISGRIHNPIKTMKNRIIFGIAAVLIGVAIGYVLHQGQVKVGAVSPVGTYQSALRADYQSISAATAATTTGSFAILNSSNDRIVTGAFAVCSGVAAETQNSAWNITAATSSVSTTTNTAYAVNMALATTSPTLYIASTTAASGTAIPSINEIWPANTYLVFSFNATDTAACTVGVNDIQL